MKNIIIQAIATIVVSFVIIFGVCGSTAIYYYFEIKSVSEQDRTWRAWRPTGDDTLDDRTLGKKADFYKKNEAVLADIYRARRGD